MRGGTGWAAPTPISSSALTSVSCPSSSLCVAVDNAGESVTFDQGTWQAPVTIDPSGRLVSVSCPSTQFCIAIDSVGNVVTFTGTSWAPPIAVDAGYVPTDVSCVSSTACTMVDQAGNVVTLSGTVWATQIAVEPRGFFGLSCSTVSFCMAYGGSGIKLFNGTAWTSAAVSGLTILGASCPTSLYCALATSSGAYTYANGIWSSYPQALGGVGLAAISCASASFCVTVGGGVAFSYTGSAVEASGTIDPHPLNAVSCSSSQFCMAVDSAGGAVPYAAPSWGSPQDVDGTSSIVGVSCAGQWCLAVDGRGDALSYQSGAWSPPTPVPGVTSFTGVSCVAIGSCVAVDSTGSVLMLNGSTWSSPLDIDGTVPLVAVSCVSTSFCLVTTGSFPGQSFAFNGSVWSTAIPADSNGPVVSVTCTSPTFCSGVAAYGYQVDFNGKTWSQPMFVGPTDPTAISCSSSTSCVGGGDSVDLSFYDGAAWTYPQSFGTYRETPTAISCVPTFCAEVDNEGAAAVVFDAGSTVAASSDPGGAAGAAITYRATVTAAFAPQVSPTGTVVFAIGSTVLCTATLNGGSGSCTATSAPSGSDTVSAIYSGDATHLQSAASPFALTVQPAQLQPAVSSVGPTSGCAVGGSQVTITGTNFSGSSVVDFGASASPGFAVTSPTTIIATVPPGTGVVDVTVTNPAGSSAPTTADLFTYGPTVTSISGLNPVGNALGGNTLYIDGTGFTGTSAVDIGGVPAASFQVVHDWEVAAVTPPETGVLDVTVTVGGCTSQVSSADRYWAWPIVTSISPPTGVTAGGTSVTIMGAGFTGTTSVDFGPWVSPSFVVVSDTEIIAVSPSTPYKVRVPVSVVTPMGPGDGSGPTYFFDPYPASGPPTITSLSLTTARAGTSISVSGTNLGDASSVTFGSTPASFTVDSGSQLTAVVPDGALFGPVTVVGTNGSTTSAQSFTVIDPATVLPSGTCTQVVADPSLAQVYVVCTSTVSVFDDSGDLLTTLSNLPQADSLIVLGNDLYVHMAGTGSIADVDTRTLSVKQVFNAGITGRTAMAYAAGLLWTVSQGTLVSVDPTTGATNSYPVRYAGNLDPQGLRSDPANPDLLYDLGAFSVINVAANPPTITIPTTLSDGHSSIGGASDGLMTPDGTHVLVDSGGLSEFAVNGPNTPVSQFDPPQQYTAVTMSTAVDGGLLAAGLQSSGLQPVQLFGLASAQPLASISFGDDDASIPARCLAISPDGTSLFAVSELNGVATFHAVPLSLPPAAPAFTSSAQNHVVAGETASIQVQTSGSPTGSITESGSLPPGLSFRTGADGTATISGTVAAGVSGNFPVQLAATNPSGTAFQTLTITVDPVPTVTSPSTATFTAQDYVYFPIASSGSPYPSIVEAGALPAGSYSPTMATGRHPSPAIRPSSPEASTR